MNKDVVQDTPDSATDLIARAIDHGASVDTLERLMVIRRELMQERAAASYFAALKAFQAECPSVPKTRKVYDKQGKVRYAYAPLDVIVDAVKDALARNGFSYTLDRGEQTLTQVEAVCIVHHVDGHSESSTFGVPVDSGAYMNGPQQAASALTYAKRYAFCNAFGIMTADEDDDATGAVSDDAPQTRPKGGDPKRQMIIADIADIVKSAAFSDAQRAQIRTEIGMAASLTGLDDVRRRWKDIANTDGAAERGWSAEDAPEAAQGEIF